MGITKTSYHHGNLRRVLLDASVSLIEKNGVAALSLRELAAFAGVSSGAPYHHFADRDQLLQAIAEEGFTMLAQALISKRESAGDDPIACLIEMGCAYIAFATAHTGYFRVMFHRRLDAEGNPLFLDKGLATYDLLSEVIEGCQRAGKAPPGDIRPLVLLAWSSVHGFSTLWVDGSLPCTGLDPSDMAPVLTQLLGSLFTARDRQEMVSE